MKDSITSSVLFINWPPSKSWRFWKINVNYCKLNHTAALTTAAVPDVVSFLESIRLDVICSPWFDVRVIFHLYPGRGLEAVYTWDGEQHLFIALPQGCINSPSPCHNLIRKGLGLLEFSQNITFVHSIDDVVSRMNEQKWQVRWRFLKDRSAPEGGRNCCKNSGYSVNF